MTDDDKFRKKVARAWAGSLFVAYAIGAFFPGDNPQALFWCAIFGGLWVVWGALS